MDDQVHGNGQDLGIRGWVYLVYAAGRCVYLVTRVVVDLWDSSRVGRLHLW
jgi:hypothetical protein